VSDTGERIRKLRKLRGITAEEVTRQLRMSSATIWRWESGKHIPPPARIYQLAEILKTSAAYLRGEIDDPSPPTEEIGKLSELERRLIETLRHGGRDEAMRLLLDHDE
jgi:transcriptional regulator with XRE-family HTH domain